MNAALEDHVGDIIRKARCAAGVEIIQAASRAGLSVHEYEQLESHGCGIEPHAMARLASEFGLSAVKLRGLLDGWRPAVVDLGMWREIRVVSTSREGLEVHCYLVWDEVTREAALFDTGWEAAPILSLLQEWNLQLRHLFLTHTHDDHMAAMGDLRAAHPKLRLHTNSRSAPPQHRNLMRDFIQLGSLRITNRATPGHAEDGVIYVVGNWPEDAPHLALVGDTLFAGSLATGIDSLETLKQSVREQIFTLPESTLICPGHGPITTVGEEKANNPYFL